MINSLNSTINYGTGWVDSHEEGDFKIQVQEKRQKQERPLAEYTETYRRTAICHTQALH